MVLHHLPDIELGIVDMPGMSGVATQGILMEHPQLPGFLVRMFTLAPGGHTGLHQHPQQHLHHVLSGTGTFVGAAGQREELRAGDVVLTEPDEFHQIVNPSADEELRFFDVVGPFR